MLAEGSRSSTRVFLVYEQPSYFLLNQKNYSGEN